MELLRAELEAVHPALPWFVLTLIIFLVIYVVRRWAPSAWKALEKQLPDHRLVSNVLQGIPAVLLGALTATALDGGDFAEAWKGALFGALAPVLHWVLRTSPLPYQGAVGEPAPSDPPDDDPGEPPPTGLAWA